MAGIRKRISRDGKPRRFYEGWYRDWRGDRKYFTGTSNKKETEAMADKFEEEHRRMRLGYAPPPTISEEERAFREVVEEYLAWGNTHGGRGGHPWGAVHARMRKTYLEFWEGQLEVQKLGDLGGALPRVEKVLQALHNDGKTGKTLTNYAEGIAAFCDWCVKRGYLHADPLKLLGAFDITPKTSRRALTSEELHNLLEKCAPERRLLYELAICTGLRAGELGALRKSHFNTQRAGLHLDGAWTKNRKPGFQPLPGWLVRKLSVELNDRNPDEQVVAVPSHPARELDKDLKAAGVAKETSEGKIDFHAFRAVYVTLVVEAGATVKEAQELARHSTPNLTMNVYARARDKRLCDVVETVGESIHPEKTCGHFVAHLGDTARVDDCNSNDAKNLVRIEEWWRRRESNPRPEVRPCVLLHA